MLSVMRFYKYSFYYVESLCNVGQKLLNEEKMFSSCSCYSVDTNLVYIMLKDCERIITFYKKLLNKEKCFHHVFINLLIQI